MSRVIPFTKCLARPKENGKENFLVNHLEGVKSCMCSLFQNCSSTIEKTMMELAAISHDIGKANVKWQEYMLSNTSNGPNHSGCGAIFFSYLAYHYLKASNEWENYKQLWLYLTRDIADHHGKLKGFAKNDEIEKGSFEIMDMNGIQMWLYEIFPFFQEHSISVTDNDLDEWQYDIFEELIEDTIDDIYDEKRNNHYSIDEMMEMLQKWRLLTSILISADRFDIEYVYDQRFNQDDWLKINNHIKQFCEKGKDSSLGKIRTNAQKSILDQWKKRMNERFYILEMPTGYGKTVTALKLASKMAKNKKMSKIIYVAPYLSIIEQNAQAIEQAIGHIPLQHHSMAILNEKTIEEDEQSDKHSVLGIQAWAHNIVCTSFVQFMKAIFPSRAQDTLRRIFFQDSIIIIDEPQIIDASVWNLFLKGLESISQIYNNTIIFCSATMPPFRYGIKNDPMKLSISSNQSSNRFQIKMIHSINALACAERLSTIKEHSGVAILNTIRDAVDVYRQLPNSFGVKKYLIHGMMIPLHKQIQLAKIQTALKQQRNGYSNDKIRVVSTQIIEAGADLSFHYMYRALPILPSLTQAAGRVNRHGENAIGTIETGKFLRDDVDTRYIYDVNLCRITDELLSEKNIWYEHEMNDIVKKFYEQMFDENSYQSVLQDIERAFEGNWERLSRHEAFAKNDIYRLPIFVPFNWNNYKKQLSESIQTLLDEFHITEPIQMYDLFRDVRYRSKWDFNKNKRFQTLFNQFVLNVPTEKAVKLVSKEDFIKYKVPILEDEYSYDSEKGLTFSDDEVNLSII